MELLQVSETAPQFIVLSLKLLDSIYMDSIFCCQL